MADIDKSYIQTLEELKSKIRTAQIKAAFSIIKNSPFINFIFVFMTKIIITAVNKKLI